ncbi:MAG: type II methionyl aminopeptidase [Methanobrevibacter sp.]|uniref:type II methionyl aminopeptidase n=1 Tax=Methanobrevibacter sp. TaxID=66852 RepID=UPI0026E06F32|nr:type II methionyl aminopeptidase [Methanobrevibacter sp.]MDO5848033.1 type II methionyl aminopeptidase [Methanobrevibacter sp.]
MIDAYIKAGKIVSEVREEASKMIKEGTLVLDLVEYVESEILKKGAGIAFPCNVSINEIAAHYTSPYQDETKIEAGDMVKLDLGAHIDGFIADSAITVMADGKHLEEKLGSDRLNKNEEIIEASSAGLDAALGTVKAGVEVWEIGQAVKEAINEYGFNPVSNLTGHSLEQYNLHAGISIPNINNHDHTKLEEGQAIAIEPFATDGIGFVNDAPGAYIFSFLADKPFRMKQTQQTLTYIEHNYPHLPFSGRWLTEEFKPSRVQRSLKQLGEAMAIYPYSPLKEKTGCWVSQKEHTVIVETDGCTITTI